MKWYWPQNVTSTSMDGIATKSSYSGGTTQWADILWNNHLIGDFSSQGLPDLQQDPGVPVPRLSLMTFTSG